MDRDAPESHLPLTFAAPARRALIAAGLTRLEQTARVGEPELLRLHGMGPRGVRRLREILAERGLSPAPADLATPRRRTPTPPTGNA